MLKYVLAFCVILTSPAFADRIDGSWCAGALKRIEITGAKISIAGKPAFEGKYTRHEFLYTAPAGEENAGAQIYMRIRGEEDMTSFTIKDNQPVDPIDWKRCQGVS